MAEKAAKWREESQVTTVPANRPRRHAASSDGPRRANTVQVGPAWGVNGIGG
jgi:hypothetical protein